MYKSTPDTIVTTPVTPKPVVTEDAQGSVVAAVELKADLDAAGNGKAAVTGKQVTDAVNAAIAEAGKKGADAKVKLDVASQGDAKSLDVSILQET